MESTPGCSKGQVTWSKYGSPAPGTAAETIGWKPVPCAGIGRMSWKQKQRSWMMAGLDFEKPLDHFEAKEGREAMPFDSECVRLGNLDGWS
mmetsp:Transcript_56640/g.92214  ORF Transcript_56640/g.92214 Transcript_56640/m.92214 type:complete len:91 (+) Transcript_56640:2-274(+)